MKKIHWIAFIGVVAAGLTVLAWSIRPATAEALQLNRETTTTVATLARTTGVTVEQDETTATATATDTSVAAGVRPGGAELLDAPNGTLLLSLNASTMLTATGRTADGQWYRVTTGETEGWTASDDLIAINAETLPRIEAAVAVPEVDASTTATPSTDTLVTDALASDALASDALATDALATTLAEAPAVVRSGGATLVANPGESQGTALHAGALLHVSGVSDDGAWLAVQTVAAPVASGWVAAEHLIYSSVRSATAVAGNTTNASNTALVSTIASTTVAPITLAAVAPATDALDTDALDTDALDTEALGTEALGTDALDTVTVASGTNNLNVRELPGTANAIVGKAAPGDALALLGKTADGSWLQVLLEDGATGWVSSNYVTGDTSAAPAMEESITNAAVTTTTTATGNADSAENTATTASSAAAATSATGLTGTIIYQTAPGGTFYAYDLETGAQWPLTSGWDPAISPDGQTVAFVRGGGETGIWLIDIDGSNERLIYGERRDLSSPKWSPDGTYIVFGRSDSYITCRQIGRECLPDSVWLDRNPNMDLSGFPLIDEYLQNLARIDVDGNNYRDLATLESARQPDWSSAGIVYASSDGLQITDDSEDAVNRVVYFEPLQARDLDPDWAGNRIVFITRQSSHYQIFSVNPDGTGKTSLTKPVTTLVDQIPSNVAPAFSPDGSQIVFLSDRDEKNEAGDWHLWVMNADGSEQRMLETIAPITYNFNNMEQAVSWGG